MKPGAPLTLSLRFQPDDAVNVGRLAMIRGTANLEFDTVLIRSGLSVDPLRYRLGPGLIPARTRYFDGLHGVFADSLPDSWGRMLLHRRLARQGIDLKALSPVDILSLIGTNGRGALIYEPADSGNPSEGPIDLDALAAESTALLAGQATDLADLLAALGGGSGGARPKVHVGLSDNSHIITSDEDLPATHAPWIVKFRAASDPEDIGPIEMAYATLATKAGLEMSDCRLIPGRDGPGYFATRRFDRGPNGKRLHMLSLCGALEAPPGETALGYDAFFRATLAVTRKAHDVAMAFRRMVFNVLAHNRDDHSRQHSFLMDRAGHWRLAPAYDLTFSHGPGGEHYLDVDGEAKRPTLDQMRKLGQRHGIRDRDIDDIVDAVRSALTGWPEIASQYGVSRQQRYDIQQILSA